MRRTILYLLFISLSAGVLGQESFPRLGEPKRPLHSQMKADTTKKPKIIRRWTLSSDYTNEIPLDIDTAFDEFHHYRKTDKVSAFNIYPGNYGLAVYQLNYFDRDWSPDDYLYSYYKPYMFTPSNPVFFNTQVPFTELIFNYGGKKANAEQSFSVRHSQNINRRLNFGFQYDIIYSLGQYKYQRAQDKSFDLHTSYNGDKYTLYFDAAINNMKVFENGGISGADNLEKYAPENVPVNLGSYNEARNLLKNRHVMLIQRYAPGARKDTTSDNIFKSNPVTFSMINSYEWNKKHYIDKYPESDFYNGYHISKEETSDSVYQGIFSNTFRMDFATRSTAKFRVGAGAGIRSELRTFSTTIPFDTVIIHKDTIVHRSQKINKNSLVLTGKIFNNIGDKFGWEATGDLWIQGYRAGDFIVNGRIFKDFTTKKGNITWDATGKLASYTPSYWYSSWKSNNTIWDFNTAREMRFELGSSIDYPGRKMNLRFNYALINNYTYFNSEALPDQYSGALLIFSLQMKKEIVVWKFHWDNTLLFQQSSKDDVLSLPLAAARTSLYFGHLFRFPATKGDLNVQAGGELFYFTPYHANGYMPNTGRYYAQTDTETGDYPYVSAFINLKLKRTRFFIMLDHLNSGLSGYDYYLVPGYPMNIRTFRYGLAWTFYN
ncbi:MAG TPA: putative porin [Bacteroidales bacterium]|nr:putative porin [Bacteroidales bacterium]